MIEIDISFITEFLRGVLNQVLLDFSDISDPWATIYIILFKYQGWLFYLYIFGRYLIYPEYMYYINNRWYAKNITQVFLAIDVPRRNEQSIQAMENFFDHLLGAHGTFSKWAQYIDGEFQLSFSCELVSIDGNIQFLIRTPKHLRNLVEAAIYGQFPDAEITEVEDYTTKVPRYFPNETHELWGCEFTLSNKNVYLPLKSWLKFEHKFTEVFVDPMAALLETMSQAGPGEQIWIQYIIKPLAVDWGLEGGKKEINKIMGKKEAPKSGIGGKILDAFLGLLSDFTTQAIDVSFTNTEEKEEKKEEQFRMMNLTPGQKEQLEGIERKISKLGFDTKIRFLYIAEKGKMNKAIGVNGIVGAIKQWTDMNANGLKPDLKTTGTNAPQYIFIEKRRNSRRNYLMGAYRRRDTVMGSKAKPMCSEELASLWHFPGMSVKSPLLKKTEFTKMAAPVGLPIEEKLPEMPSAREVEPVQEKQQFTPSFDYDNDQFEKQFALDKESFAKSRPVREKRLQEIDKEEIVKAKAAQKAALEAAKQTKKKEKQDEAQTAVNLLQKTVETAAKQPVKVTKPLIKENNEDTKAIPGNLPFID